jgi:NAD(P)-dependent dehydrogenase (short-subunit alcohol dehydrogenase family)
MHTNVLGIIHLFTLFTPLVLAGTAKKVIYISTGVADVELIRTYDLMDCSLYGISKAAGNMVVARFSAAYKIDGVLFLSLSPGVVDTGHGTGLSQHAQERVGYMVKQVAAYAPDWKGPLTPEESVSMMRSVIDGASVEKGDGGAFLSHLGNKRWI